MENRGPPQEGYESLKRDNESVDDFEHLGHDSSPLQEHKQNTGDLLGLNISNEDTHLPDGAKIDIQERKLPGDFPTIPHAGDSLFDQPLVPQKMDSNLLEMNNPFPDRKEADQKLDKFLQEMSAPFAPSEPTKQEKFNVSNLQSFMDNERGPLKDLLQEKHEKGSTEILEGYSDSEPESDDFKNTKHDELSRKTELPKAFISISNTLKQTDNFKDIEESQPELLNKDSPPYSPVAANQETIEIAVKDEIKEIFPKVEPKTTEKKTEVPASQNAEKNTKKSNAQKITEAEALFCKMGLDAWFNPERLNPKVESLIYWRDPKKSGPVFGGVLLILLALTYFSFISVVAYLSLFALTGTIAFRIYKNIVQAIQKTGDGHPFKEYLQSDVSLSQEKVKEVSEIAVAHLNAAVCELRRLFLVEDLVDSIKFGVLLWVLTYLGSWFNGMTLVIISWVALFTLPKVYEANKTQIDANLEIVRTKLADITSKVKAAIPIGKKSEEKKE